MDLMKDIYKKELRTRIAAWEGKKTDDFQYEPERAELKAQMKDWLAEKLGVDDEKKLLIANRKYFATCIKSSWRISGSPNPQKTTSLKSFKSYLSNSALISSTVGSFFNHNELFSIISFVCLKQKVHEHVQRFVEFT
jgi:hypothetical protein